MKKLLKLYLLLYPVFMIGYGLFHAIFGVDGFWLSLDHLFFSEILLFVLFNGLWLCGLLYFILINKKTQFPKKALFYLAVIMITLYLSGGPYTYLKGFHFLFTTEYGLEALKGYYIIAGITLTVIPVLPGSILIIPTYLHEQRNNKACYNGREKRDENV